MFNEPMQETSEVQTTQPGTPEWRNESIGAYQIKKGNLIMRAVGIREVPL